MGIFTGPTSHWLAIAEIAPITLPVLEMKAGASQVASHTNYFQNFKDYTVMQSRCSTFDLWRHEHSSLEGILADDKVL